MTSNECPFIENQNKRNLLGISFKIGLLVLCITKARRRPKDSWLERLQES